MSNEVQNSKEHYFSLSSISSRIREAIYEKFADGLYWVVAEISELAVRKGHCYISLVEKLPDSAAPLCELKGIIWANKFEKISKVFKEITGTEIAAHTRILFQASVRYDVKWGLNLIIEDVEPRYTVGLLQMEREQTIKKLKEEGVFSNNKNLQFPVVPQRIAVLSAKDSRGYEDFLSKLEKNAFGYRYLVTLFPTLLQGEQAASNMVTRLIEIYENIKAYDLVVIVRGGGGAIDLNCFNNYKLARAIARFPIPVITGIGHTTNISVADEVAFADRITPTDAADFILEKTRTFELYLQIAAGKIRQQCQVVAMNEMQRLDHTSQLIKIRTENQIEQGRYYLAGTTLQVKNSCDYYLSTARNFLFQCGREIFHLSRSLLEREHTKSLQNAERVKNVPLRYLRSEENQLEKLELNTRHLDPANILKRGFSITLINGKAVKNSDQIKKGDFIKTILHEGTIESQITGKDA